MADYNFLAYLLYGHDQGRQSQISFEDKDRYARAILTIAAADGLSERERDYFLNLARGMGMPDAAVAAYAKYDPSSEKLDDLLAPLRGRQPVPYLLYDAIKVASVDGYTDKERAKVDSAARALGVRLDVVRTLEGLVAAEAAIRDARIGLFASIEAESPS